MSIAMTFFTYGEIRVQEQCMTAKKNQSDYSRVTFAGIGPLSKGDYKSIISVFNCEVKILD